CKSRRTKMKQMIFILIFTIFLAGAYSAKADTLYTGAITSTGSDAFFCSVTNATTASVSVTITVYDDDGNIKLGPAAFQVAKRSVVVSAAVGTTTFNLYYCKVNTANKSDIRATGFIRNASTGLLLGSSEGR